MSQERTSQPDDLVERVLNLIEGLPASEVHACGMMLISIALSKMHPVQRDSLLEGLEWRISDNVAEFDKAARHLH
jgi:hypothetical protein